MTHAARVGVFIVLLYIICIVWPMIYPYSNEVLAFHLLSLKLTFPVFVGYTVGSIVWGGVLSFIYGAVASLVVHAFHRGCCSGKK